MPPIARHNLGLKPERISPPHSNLSGAIYRGNAWQTTRCGRQPGAVKAAIPPLIE